jgi:hypothetical protein
MGNWGWPLESPRLQGSERLPGPSGDDFSQTPQQRGDRTCRDYLQWIGMTPSWGMGSPIHLKVFNTELFPSKGKTRTKKRNRDWKAIQRPPYLGIHPICRYQTQTLLLMPRSACWPEPDIAVSWKALMEPDQYRGRCSQPTLELNMRTPNGGVRGRSWSGLIWHQWEGRPLVLWMLDARV